jgi:predicted HicB family RNase H-like nuclease
MTYKGYTGVAQFDDEAGIFFGRVLDLRDVITFQGTTVEGLRQSFRDSVNFYLECCAADGVAPEKPYTGQILVRTKPEVHRALAVLAGAEGKSINAIINRILTKAVRKAPASSSSRTEATATRPVKVKPSVGKEAARKR